MRTAIVILHYGSPQLTGRLYAQLLGADPKRADDILVLDNHAPQPFEGAWHRTDRNLYWAGALEYALASVQRLGYTHLWFLNNDILFETPPPVLDRAEVRIKRMQKRIASVGVYAPAVVRSPYHEHMIADARYQFRRVPFVDGIAPLINIDCWQALGGVDYEGNAYGYGVDMWFSLQAHRAGWSVIVDHGVVVRHTYHSTAGKIEGFLLKAAAAEHDYLTARLGPDYKNTLAAYKRQFIDEEFL
ncbi:hypothetical protein [Oleidesulfovibrio sp.]|uniref:hypothetical protein n=1 Tax=Oleidesulfovibrio sp. TaxID=2909707 RepID=UPI003A89ED97